VDHADVTEEQAVLNATPHEAVAGDLRACGG